MVRVRLAFLLGALVAGCAGGASSPAGPNVASIGSAGSVSANPSETSGTSEDSGETTVVSDPSEGDSSGPGEPGSSSGEPESTSTTADPSSAEVSSDGGDDSSPPPDCPNLATCNNAEVIGMVSGDEGSPMLEASGADATWLTFQVTEDNDSVLGEGLSFTATLTSPPGVDFDLFVYRGAVGGPSGCNGVMDSSRSAGANDVVHATWGEAAVANGVDDRAWVAVEIVPKGEVCGDGSEWTLTIDGDS